MFTRGEGCFVVSPHDRELLRCCLNHWSISAWNLPSFQPGNIHDDPNPDDPAYVSPGTGTDGVEIDNPEDYDLNDLAQYAYKQSDTEARSVLQSRNLASRELQKRFPVDWKSILSAPTSQSNLFHSNMIQSMTQKRSEFDYGTAFHDTQPKTKQLAFYVKELRKGSGKWDFLARPMSKRLPNAVGTLHVEHVLEVQRVKTLFRHPMPVGVTKRAWDMMQVAVYPSTNSVRLTHPPCNSSLTS